MIVSHPSELPTGSKRICTSSSAVLALTFLLWSSLMEISDAWGCSRCDRVQSELADCCLFSPDDECCLNPPTIEDLTEIAPVYECSNQPSCTRVYTCGTATYACSPIFDFAIIQFNAESESSCSSIIPLDPDQDFEYCETDLYCGTDGHLCEDCGDLCSLSDDELAGHTCPNGQQIDFFFTVCNEEFPASEFSTYITEDDIGGFDEGLLDEMKEQTDLFDENDDQSLRLYDQPLGHSSCFNFGEVSCEKFTRTVVFLSPTSPAGTSPSQSQTTKKSKKRKKRKSSKSSNSNSDASEPCRQRKLRSKRKGRSSSTRSSSSSSSGSSSEEDSGEDTRDC